MMSEIWLHIKLCMLVYIYILKIFTVIYTANILIIVLILDT